MRIEYFPDGDEGRPLVLLYGDDLSPLSILAAAVQDLIDGHANAIAVHQLPGFEAVGGCELFFLVVKRDLGARLVSLEPPRVECAVRPVWWENVAGLLKPFDEPGAANRHQYLTYGFYSEVELIVSTARSW